MYAREPFIFSSASDRKENDRHEWRWWWSRHQLFGCSCKTLSGLISIPYALWRSYRSIYIAINERLSVSFEIVVYGLPLILSAVQQAILWAFATFFSDKNSNYTSRSDVTGWACVCNRFLFLCTTWRGRLVDERGIFFAKDDFKCSEKIKGNSENDRSGRFRFWVPCHQPLFASLAVYDPWWCTREKKSKSLLETIHRFTSKAFPTRQLFPKG